MMWLEYDDFLWFYPVGLIFEMIIQVDGLIHDDLQILLSSVYTDFHPIVKESATELEED